MRVLAFTPLFLGIGLSLGVGLCLISSVHAFVPGLLDQGRKMVALIEEARTCSVKYRGDKDELTLCTGLVLEKQDLKFLKELQLKSCQQFLTQMGYKVHKLESLQGAQKDKKLDSIGEEVLKDFFNSTKLAWILHREKVILFKPEAKRGDCLHEVLHFYQRQRPRKNALAPLERKNEEARLQFLLEQAVAKVEQVEKSGDKKKTKEMAAQLQPFISLQKEWQRLITWLDEKEIYQAFFDFPQLFLLSDRDKDIALANLVRLKDSLPWDLKERVLFAAQAALNNKYREVLTPRNLSGFKSEEEYGALYNAGKLTRDNFEEKVIAIRKYKAWQKVKVARRKGLLFETLQALGQAREFSKKQTFFNQKVTLKYQLYKDLPSVEVDGFKFIIDTGANDSVMPKALLKSFKEKELRLLALKSLQTVQGKVEQSPQIQLLKPLKVGDVSLKGLIFSVNDLGLPGIDGIIGMDFFKNLNQGKWHWSMKERKISPLDNDQQNYSKTYYLQANGRGLIDALEFKCKENLKVRLDSGSQVWGDAPNKYKGEENDSFASCLPRFEKGKILEAPKYSALFSRGVHLNVGHDYLKTLKMMAFDLNKREFYLLAEASHE